MQEQILETLKEISKMKKVHNIKTQLERLAINKSHHKSNVKIKIYFKHRFCVVDL